MVRQPSSRRSRPSTASGVPLFGVPVGVERAVADACFEIAGIRVLPERNLLVSPGGEHHLQPKVMDVLVLLARRAGEVVSHDDFIREVWAGANVGDDSLVHCVSTLRRLMNGHAGLAQVIETIPKRGYCLVAPVTDLDPAPGWRRRRRHARVTLAGILASCSDHVYVYDRDHRYLMVSEAGARAIGIEARDMIGKSWQELGLPAEIMEPFFVQVASVFDGGPSIRESVSYPTIEGQRDYEYILDPVMEDGEVVAVMAFVREIPRKCATCDRQIEPPPI